MTEPLRALILDDDSGWLTCTGRSWTISPDTP